MPSSLSTAGASCAPDHVLGIARENIFGLIKTGAPIMIVVLVVGLVTALFQPLTQMQHRGRDRRPRHLGLPGHHSDADPTLAAMPIGRCDMPSSLLAAGAS
jgi:hypothetical protein